MNLARFLKADSLKKTVLTICCTLAVMLGLQAAPFMDGSAIAAPSLDQLIAGNYPSERVAINKAKEDTKSAFDRVAGSGTSNKIEGTIEQAYGKAQKQFGNASNQIQGNAKQFQGRAKQDVGRTQNAVENATDKVQKKAENAVEAVKDFFSK